MKTIILIPARMESTRLPGKPLADICGIAMIVRVAMRAADSRAGDVAVATDSEDIARTVRDAGFEAVMTRSDHQTGSDRIFEALEKIDPQKTYDTVINLQGDLPAIDPHSIKSALLPLDVPGADIATLGVEISDDEERTNPNVVKIVGSPIGKNRLKALYFTRATAPWGDGPLYHHVGLYAYRREALARFVKLSPSVLEKREKLEQLRALEAGMSVHAEIVDSVPVPVDTPADLEKARQILAANKGNRT